ncbi:MAG: transposase [Proteobacteria bacterium]|nr:transposase [Pseudomonadota bacterium]
MKNPVPFQRGLPLSECLGRSGTEAKCEAALAAARGPTGCVCPRCRGSRYLRFDAAQAMAAAMASLPTPGLGWLRVVGS